MLWSDTAHVSTYEKWDFSIAMVAQDTLCVKWVVERVEQDWVLLVPRCSCSLFAVHVDIAVPHFQHDSHFSFVTTRTQSLYNCYDYFSRVAWVLYNFHPLMPHFTFRFIPIQIENFSPSKREREWLQLENKKLWVYDLPSPNLLVSKWSGEWTLSISFMYNEHNRESQCELWTKSEIYSLNGNAWQGKIPIVRTYFADSSVADCGDLRRHLSRRLQSGFSLEIWTTISIDERTIFVGS